MLAIDKIFNKKYKIAKNKFNYKLANQILANQKRDKYYSLYLSFVERKSLINQFIEF